MKLTAMADIVILVSSLHKVKETGQQFVFTDRHAYLQTAMYSSELSDLKTLIDWPQLRARDFQRDPEKPEKFERYQAEALVHSHLPLAGLVGAACQNAEVQQKLLDAAGPILSSTLKIMTLPKWFFLT